MQSKKIPTIGWFYLRGKQIANPHDPEKLAYAARLALELGADGVKLQFAISGNEANDLKNLKWIVQNAGKCKVFISGGSKASDEEMFSLTKITKVAGCAGMAVGRNIWQRDNPVEFAKKIGEIIYA